MAIFCRKKIVAPARLGEKFQQARAALGQDMETLSAAAQVPGKYLAIMESGRWQELPKARVYRAAYLRAYAGVLRLPVAEVLEQFAREGGWQDVVRAADSGTPRPIRARFSSLSILARNFLFLFLVAAFAGYLAWQVKEVLRPPRLTVFSPLEGYVTSRPSAMVQGETETETHLTINGQEVRPNEKGQFESAVDLSHGVNTITISAIKKHGKTTTIIRHVVANKFE